MFYQINSHTIASYTEYNLQSLGRSICGLTSAEIDGFTGFNSAMMEEFEVVNAATGCFSAAQVCIKPGCDVMYLKEKKVFLECQNN